MVDVGYSAEGSARAFRIGSVLRDTIGVFGRAPVAFILLSIVPVIPAVVKELVVPMAAASPFAKANIVVTPFHTVLAYLFQASITYGSYHVLIGRTFDVGEALSVGFRRFLPIIGASLVAGLIILVGYVLLIVPGLVASAAMMVVVPACVVERLGPVESIRRSAALTKGYRARLVGLLVVVGFAVIVLTFLARAVGMSLGGVLAGQLAINVVQVFSTAIGAVLAAVAYYALRAAKEGFAIETIADVFD